MKEQYVKRKDILFLAIALVALMIVGTFADLGISKAVYNENSTFGMIFAAYGEIPSLFCFIAYGVIMLMHRDREKKFKMVLQIVGGVILTVLGCFMAIAMPSRYLPESWNIINIVIGVLIIAASIFVVYKISKGKDRKEMMRLALGMFVISIGAMLLINIVKIPWGRPRMRLMAVDSTVVFQPWYVISSQIKNSLLASGVLADELKSFPSGHTGNAACAMMIAYLARYSGKLQSKERLFWLIGVLWAALVAFSRIVMGAHFLTDVVVGFLITLLLFYIVKKFIIKDI